MKYTYAYKTSDGRRHEDAMEAESREAVFVALRARRIKAIKVVAADGSKANGEVRGVRKRVVVAVALAVALIAGAVAFWLGRGRPPGGPLVSGGLIDAPRPTAPRHQIYGDPVVVDEIARGKTEPWLTNRVDRLLAWFAQPGKLMCPKGTDPRSMADLFTAELSVLIKSESTTNERLSVLAKKKAASEQLSVLIKSESTSSGQLSVLIKSEKGAVRSSPLTVTSSDPREVRELKQIVNGLREEMSAYLANGNGTPRSYWRRLLQRTEQEAQIYERTRRELEHETDAAVFERKNQALRNLGLRTIPNPKDAE